MLKFMKYQYYTYKPKNERGFNVILRNMHYSTDPEEIKQELLSLNHHVINIHNILQRGSKKPTSLFSIELVSSPNNKEIYGIQYLLNCKISFEPPHHKRTIPQCSYCQKYGHTRNFCHLNPVCVKCAGNHKTVDCTKTKDDNSTKCALCSGNHTANYKGCEIYKTLKVQRFPKVRNKQLNNPSNISPTQNVDSIDTSKQNKMNPSNEKNPSESYATVLAKNTMNQAPNTSINDFSELKQMMKEMMAQISSMLNVILSLIQKLDGK